MFAFQVVTKNNWFNLKNFTIHLVNDFIYIVLKSLFFANGMNGNLKVAHCLSCRPTHPNIAC
jgi:hypothetical protein